MRSAALLAFLGLSLPLASQEAPEREGIDFFEKRIRPVLVERCYKCHSHKADKVKGNLFLDTREGLLKGGDMGPAVVPGNLEKSLLIKAIRYTDEDLQMPPKNQKLPAEQVKAFEEWVKAGAPSPHAGLAAGPMKPVLSVAEARRRWPFNPVVEPPLPPSPAAHPVDRFILAKLGEKGLKPVGPADQRTLVRRATYDLLGLPPTPEEIDAFLKDDSPDAFSRLVDRLLASPHYGERWGRHWMDVIRYADTAGDNSDYPIPQMHKYRNWVIKAFNDDKPYDRFIREQIAGDLLPYSSGPDKYEKIVATGYLANARRFGSRVDDYPWHLTIEDTIDNLGRTFLGLTVNCARCHDHKFDPIFQDDYYGLYGIFQSIRYSWPGIELEKMQRDLVPLEPAEKVEAVMKARAEKKAGFEATLKRLESEKAACDKGAKDAPPGLEDEAAAAAAQSARVKAGIDAAKKQLDHFNRTTLPLDTAYAVAEAKKIGDAKIQIKGDPERQGKEVPRHFPVVMGGHRLAAEARQSGRIELASWIADPSNPLTARVMANRIWHWHFGRGIVPTPSDFGKQGHPPTHPELLDYLARRFVEGGWSFKSMHRLIMSSRTYQLSSGDDDANVRTDPRNEWLWRFHRRRLDAESIRDAMLAVSGALDPAPGGPHPFPPQEAWDFTQHKPYIAVYDHARRSVYLMTQRIRRHPYLALFDGPDPNASTASRVTSTTPLQALFLMNDPFVHEQARRFAERVAKARPNDAGRIELAYLLALGRPPSEEEREAGRDFLARVREKAGDEAWPSYARVIFRLNEFVYVR